ncbi:MAG: hypothetical protein ACRCT7_18860, partial [Shewanella sp.]
MKKTMILALVALMWGTQAQAVPVIQELQSCNKDVNALECQSYLDGIVDGALIFKGNSVGKRLEPTGYEERALKYRGGNRFKEANRVYCADRIPDRSVLVAAVSEAVTTGVVTTQDALTEVMVNLLDC